MATRGAAALSASMGFGVCGFSSRLPMSGATLGIVLFRERAVLIACEVSIEGTSSGEFRRFGPGRPYTRHESGGGNRRSEEERGLYWGVVGARCSFWMRDDVEEVVHVAFGAVVEAPVVIDARLKARRVVAFRLEGRMPPVAHEKCELLAEGLLYFGRSNREGGDELVSENDAHGVPVA